MRSLTKIIQLLLALSAVSCHKQSNKISSVKKITVTTNNKNQDSVDESLSLAKNQRIYIKNCEQAVRTMEKLTGVSAKEAAIQNIISETKGSCPSSSDPESFDAPQIVAFQKIALEFCGEFIKSSVSGNKIEGFNSNLPPSEAFSDASRSALYRDLYSRFWMAPRTGVPSFESLKESLDVLIDELQRSAPRTAAATQSIFQGSCAAVLSASPVITL